MPYKIKLSKKYKQAYKKIDKQGRLLIDEAVQKLSNNKTLEPKYKDHALKKTLNDLTSAVSLPKQYANAKELVDEIKAEIKAENKKH